VYLLKLALRPWRLAPFSQVFSALAVGCLLTLMGFLFWMDQGLKPVLRHLSSEEVVTAYLDPSSSGASSGLTGGVSVGSSGEGKDDSHVTDAIRTIVGAHPTGDPESVEVKKIGVVQFVGKLKASYPELARELEGLGDEVDSIIPRYVTVSGVFAPGLLDKIRAIPGVESAESSRNRYGHIVSAFSSIRWIARAMAAGLAVALVTGLVLLSRMNNYFHRDTLTLLRLWGASSWSLRLPALLSGGAVGLMGGLIAGLGWMIWGTWLTGQIRILSPILREMPSPDLHLVAVLLVSGILIGVFSGLSSALWITPSSSGSSGAGGGETYG